MRFGKNLQYLRRMFGNITQEALAEKLNVSRQTVSKWELDESKPDIDKAIEICEVFNCSLDSLFREEMGAADDAYSNLRVEMLPGFRYIKHTVISNDPERDAICWVRRIAQDNGVEHPKVIGWIFRHVSPEQISVYRMHGFEAAWVLPEGMTPSGVEIKEQQPHKYVALHISGPIQNPFVTIPNAYKTMLQYMRLNGLEQGKKDAISHFMVDGDFVDLYITCE